jgi:hypothetical protein
MIKGITVLALSIIFSCVSSGEISAAQPGTTDTVFNRRFIQKLKPLMPYDQLVKIVGSEGTKVGDDKRSSPPTTSYHWNGERKSALDIKVAEGKVMDITVTAPKKQRFSLGKNGELVELGK